ncbi:MAG: LacI family DNA-binding transcriptional regulator [Clostridia bacterium]|nr:LacI family DNA-binding transcriptional regulator [Clostridia bacterium]
MNLSKLAKLANVSVSTVSKAFADSDEISKETKERIIELAKETNCYEKYYRPKYPKKLIVVICPEILGLHYGQMATNIEKEITENGDTMVLSVSNFSAARQNDLIDYYTKYLKPDGIIVIEPAGTIKNNTDIPIVQISFENAAKNVYSVKADIYPALNEALTTLQNLGHTKIGFIGEKYATAEFEFFKNAMAKKEIYVRKKHIVISDKRFLDAGYFGMEEMLKNGSLPTAIIAAYSHISVGMMQRIKECGLRVPEDISVICMDDINVMPYSDKTLSCIKMHLDELSCIAIDMLYQKIKRGYIRIEQAISVTREFEPGDTIGPASNQS